MKHFHGWGVMARRLVVYIVIAVAALAIATAAILAFRGRSRSVIRAGASPQDIEAVVAYGADEVSAGISSIFSASGRGASSSRFLAFDLHSAGDPIFPDDYQLRAQTHNPGLARYVTLD